MGVGLFGEETGGGAGVQVRPVGGSLNGGGFGWCGESGGGGWRGIIAGDGVGLTGRSSFIGLVGARSRNFLMSASILGRYLPSPTP